jgi:hypothetical protein
MLVETVRETIASRNLLRQWFGKSFGPESQIEHLERKRDWFLKWELFFNPPTRLRLRQPLENFGSVTTNSDSSDNTNVLTFHLLIKRQG